MTLSTLLSVIGRRTGALMMAAALFGAADVAAQTTYVVASDRDQTEASAAVPNGVLTLREAVIAANTDAAFGDAPAGSGADIIQFGSGITQVLLRSPLTVSAGVTIGEAGLETSEVTLTVPANRPTRILDITTTESVVLNNVAIDGGFATTGGGGIRLTASGLLTLSNVSFSSNRAPDGGALYVSPGATVGMSNVAFIRNRALGSSSTNGGGAIYTAGAITVDPFLSAGFFDNLAIAGSGSGGAVYIADGGDFTINFTIADADGGAANKGVELPIFSGNRAARAGGAIEVREGGRADIANTSFFGNRAGNSPGNGGALHITGAGSASVSQSAVANNFARNEGGGLWNSGIGSLTITETTVSNNTTVGNGGGVFQQAGESGTTLIQRSTLSGNTASGFGGGLFVGGAQVDIENSTLSGNSATRGGGGYSAGATVMLASSTVAANTASGLGGGFANPEIGQRVDLQNTLVADNSAPSGPQLSGYFVSSGNNLIEDLAGSGVMRDMNIGDVVDVDAMIGPLDFNGGPTQTHALLLGSPAIDAGMTDLAGDQRGEVRTDPDDIGSYDFGATMAGDGAMIITGVFDGPLSGGTPKVVELYVTEDIADLSLFGVSSANNGGGATGTPEFTFPMGTATAGDFLYVVDSNNADEFLAYFGVTTTYESSAAGINGDDAIELFLDGTVVDVFGDVDTDGSNEAWDYLDGWAYRTDGTGPDGSTFVVGNWTYSGINVNDNQTTNGTAPTPFPIGSYTAAPPFLQPTQTAKRTTGLSPVAPNPIRSTGRVQFSIAQSEAVSVDLYDMMGRRVQSLYTGTPTAESVVDVAIDASALASGVYVVVLQSQSQRETQRVTIAR